MTRPGQIDRARVTSTEPGPVRREQALLQLWGDEEAGWVNDWVYVSSERLYQIVLSMPPRTAFTHSERNRTIFGADELYYVLRGRLLLANPETGDLVSLGEGDAAWFGPDTWHHGFAAAESDTQVLEFFAPPPAAGMSQAYARTRPYLERRTYVRNDGGAAPTIHPAREVIWRLEDGGRLLVGLLVSTPRLTVAHGELLPGQASAERSHGGDLGLYLLKGTLNVHIDGRASEQLRPGDGLFVPAGHTYRLGNRGDRTTAFVFAVAPDYLSSAGRTST